MFKTFFLFLVLLILNSSNLYSKEKTYKIAITTDMKPYTYLDDDKKAKGILVDYWKLWAKKSSLKVEFVPFTWQESIRALKENKVDIHSGLYKNKSRSKYIKYLNKTYITKSSIHIFKEDKEKFFKVRNLKNFSLGVIKGSFYQDFFESNFPDIKLTIFNEYKTLYKAIKEKTIDSFVNNEVIVWMNIERIFDYNALYKIKDFKLKNWFYAGVAKDNNSLDTLVTKGMNKISKSELLNIQEKWISKKEFRYLENDGNSSLLNEEEFNYLNSSNDITLATLNKSKGYSFRNEENKLVGFHVDLVNLMNKNLDINIKLKGFTTWSEAYTNAKNNLVDGIFYLSWSKQREEYFNYTTAYKFSPFKIIVRNSEKHIKDINNLNNKKIAVIKKSITITTIKRLSPQSIILEFNNPKEMYKALKEKKVDAVILATVGDNYDFKKYDLQIISEVFVKEGELYIGINKKRELSSSIINKAINSISKKELVKLQKKWFSKNISSKFTKEELRYIKESKVLKIGIDDWEPIEFSKNKKDFEGIAGDIFKRIAEISGLKFEIEVDKWHKLLKKLENKKIDILPAVVQNSKRDKYALFTQKYLINKSSIFIKKNSSIRNFKDLEGKRLAIVKSLSVTSEIKKRFPKIKIIEKDSLTELITLLQKDEVSAFFALEINAKTKIKDSLISNIKVLYQDDIKSLDIKIASRKDDLILNSILKKSLYYISHIEKNKIISKWLNSYKSRTTIDIIINSSEKPYSAINTNLKGIEYDLIDLILSKSDISINSFKKSSLHNIKKEFKNNEKLDAIINEEYKKNKYFYSNNFISFQKVILSREEDKLTNISINTLINKNITAYQGAKKDLNKLFGINFERKTKQYQEIENSEQQVLDFLNKKTDIIIINENTFKWYLKKHSSKSLDSFKLDYIYAKNNFTKVAFKNSNLRDTFNKNLELIQSNGEYQDILKKYLENDILLKLELNSFFANVLSKEQFLGNIKELKNILKILSSLSYINKIEVFTNRLIISSSNKNYKKPMKQKSYYLEFNIPQDVGYIKIYYDEAKLKEAKDNLNLIPNLNKFNSLNSYSHIKGIYKYFNYLEKDIEFTKKEKEFIEENHIIRFSSRKWEPLSIIENDKYNGLISDYMKIIEEKTSLKFKLVKINTWDKILSAFKNKEIDFLPSVANTKEYKDLGLISNKYEDFHYSIVTNKEGSFINKIKDLENKTLAIPKFYTPYKYIKEKYPNIKVIGTKNIKEALALVSTNKVDAFIGHEATSVFYIKKFFPDLKIAGLSEKKFEHHFLISKDKEMLLDIINKVLASISYEQKLNIRDKWIKKKINLAVDYSIIYQIIFVFLIILLIVFYFIQKINNAKKKIQEQKESFEKLFNDASDGLLLMRGLKFFECNNAALKLLKYAHKKDLLDLFEEDLSPALQPDGENSKKKRRNIMKECNTNGSANFEWVHIKSTGEHCWLDVTLTKIVLNNENITHVVWRDINNKKLLQQQIKRRNEELEDSNEELEATINNLKQAQEQLIDAEKMASLGGLVAGVAHEINTPVGIGLTGITHLEELSKDILEKYNKQVMSQEEFEEYLHTSKDLHTLIHSNLKKAADLVKSFKQVAVDQSSEEMRSFNINNYMKEILASIRSITKKTKINIEYTCDEKIEVNSYPGSYSQIITNLIMNSIIHGFKEKQEGNIVIQILQENENIIIYYKDSGVGIKKDNINKIFDPFFTTNRENGGSGLGLNIIYNIITSKLKGSISCKSDEGKGVEFNIILKMGKGIK